MPTYVAILRGINVGGSKKLKMADLTDSLKKHGFENILTYIQSGNVRFDYKKESPEKLASKLSKIIQDEYSYDVPVVIVSAKNLDEVLENNPFPQESEMDEKSPYVTFLSSKPKAENLEKIQDQNPGEDKFVVFESWIYLYCPNGYGRTKLTNNFFENKLKVTATTRNWKTVKKLLEMAKGD